MLCGTEEAVQRSELRVDFMIRFIIRAVRALRSRIRIAGCAIKYVLCRAIPQFSRKERWVICERGTDARDNGYVFYRYLIENHPELQIYYLITADSTDYKKVAPHAVIYGSFKNYWVVAKASRIISTHCYTALPVKSERVWRTLGLERKFCFLQHGIIKASLPYLFGDRTAMRLFCTAGVSEYEYVRKSFLHPEGVVRCTGLARYDQLYSCKTKNQILVMPTWRRWINSENAFLESEYYVAWCGLLSDERLLKYLSDTETQLVFYPHYEMQPYLKHFKPKSPQVVLGDFDHYDVQKLLKESKMLITDYSSVFFDFAYMQKPIIYYQFDSDRFYRQHYSEGYFQTERDGFGAVVSKHEELVEQILKTAERGYEMELGYKVRTNSFFAHRDQLNCERIYQAIQSI